MKAEELRNKTDEELVEAYDETRQELFDLQVRKDIEGDAAGNNPVKARLLRRDVARIKTLMKERQVEGAK
jgi:large subunit ribosomal protein L29